MLRVGQCGPRRLLGQLGLQEAMQEVAVQLSAF